MDNEMGPDETERKTFPNPEALVELPERLKFLQLDEEDARRLRELRQEFKKHGSEFIEQFYAHLLHFDESARHLTNEQLLERLKRLLLSHFDKMFEANWDEQYETNRHQVGATHAATGIDPQIFLGSYSQFIQFCQSRLLNNKAIDKAENIKRFQSISKAVFLDINLTLEAYFQHLTENMQRALDMVWQTNNELKQFARLASHDLKTPLGTVANLCEEVLDEFGPEMPQEAKKLIRSAQNVIYRMSDTISELLQTTMANRYPGDQSCVDARVALKQAVERVRPAIEKKRIVLVLPSNIPSVLGDPVRLREAFYNIISNSEKFIDRNDGRIEISVEKTSEHCIFRIVDNGPGISDGDTDRVFQAFRRLPQHEHHSGTGLGLYFTKMLVEQMQGRVWASSQEGKGCAFYIQLHLAHGPLANNITD